MKIDPSKLSGFISGARQVADDMEAMVNSTPLEKQSEEAVKILRKHDML